jgi:outer membrane protein assembly factor BamA
MTNFFRSLATLLCVVSLAAPAAAQQTETGKSDDAGFVGRIKDYLDKQKDGESKPKEREPEGFYARIGGLTTGSGFAAGGGYRTHLFDRALYGDLSGVVSLKRYVALDGRLRLPSPSPDFLEFWTSVAYRRFPQEDYFGLGAESLEENRSNYRIDSVDVGGQAIVLLTPAFRVGADIGYFMPTLKPGTDSRFPSTELLFTDATAPGLSAQPDFLHYGLFVTGDTRDVRGNPRNGGLYEVTLAQWNDRSFDAYNFRRFDAEARHYVSLGSPRHVVAGRGGLSFVNNSEGARVPFYVYPYVGGANSIRSYTEFRFRDENAFFVSGEYRFGLMKYVQLVGFADAGKVASDWQDINFSDLKKGYGFGIRAGLENRTFVRLDIGTGGGEGRHIFLKFLPSF